MVISTNPIGESTAQFAADVRTGLSKAGQKELPSKYLYDELGSSLFEAITLLPEYGVTRADERLLQRHARDIVRRIPDQTMVSELGSGSGRKTRWILNALGERGAFRYQYYPIEISHAALALCETALSDIEGVSILGVEREYLDGLSDVAALRPPGMHLFVLFLGSTIGNFDDGADARFLSDVRSRLTAGDSLLLGTDLIKPREVMIEAYDDPQGVTAAFNLNLLGRINRELDAQFNLRMFEHLALFNESTSSIEMHLRSRRAQQVRVSGEVVNFEAGETIWTETSRKYTPKAIEQLAQASGFRIDGQWIDREWPFANTLLVAV